MRGDLRARNEQSRRLAPRRGARNTPRDGRAEAEQLYKNALAVDPTAAGAANNLAWLYVASNRNLDDALKLAQDARKMLPEEPAVNDTLGWIVVTGPTGAGKSTTLYSLLAERRSSAINIVTIEDPVEYQDDGITQTQIQSRVRRRATEAQLAAAAAAAGTRFLLQDAMAKVRAGSTTVEEIARVMRVDPQEERALQRRPTPRRDARTHAADHSGL